MKKLIYVAMLCMPIIFGCTDKKELNQLKEENNRLQSELGKRDSTVNDMFKSFGDIEENLSQIRAKQMVVGQSTAGKSGELSTDSRDRITQEIQMINDLIEQNKKTINNLRAQLKKSNMKIGAFEKIIKNLEKQIEEKDAEIASLKDKLEKLNFTVEELNAKVENLNTESTQKTEVITKQTEEIHTAWYVIGNSKELVSKNIIIRKGGVIGIGKTSRIAKDMNTDYFTKVDTRKVTEIPIASKKAQVLSTHPQNSFELVMNGKTFEKLIIKDSKRFWSISKYLIIEVE